MLCVGEAAREWAREVARDRVPEKERMVIFCVYVKVSAFVLPAGTMGTIPTG